MAQQQAWTMTLGSACPCAAAIPGPPAPPAPAPPAAGAQLSAPLTALRPSPRHLKRPLAYSPDIVTGAPGPSADGQLPWRFRRLSRRAAAMGLGSQPARALPTKRGSLSIINHSDTFSAHSSTPATNPELSHAHLNKKPTPRHRPARLSAYFAPRSTPICRTTTSTLRRCTSSVVRMRCGARACAHTHVRRSS